LRPQAWGGKGKPRAHTADKDEDALLSSGEEDFEADARQRRRNSSGADDDSEDGEDALLSEEDDEDDAMEEEEEEEEEEDLTSDEEVDAETAALHASPSSASVSLEADLMSGGVPDVPRPGVLRRTLSIAPALAVSNQETAIRYGDTIRLYTVSRYTVAALGGGYVGYYLRGGPAMLTADGHVAKDAARSKKGRLMVAVPPVGQEQRHLFAESSFEVVDPTGAHCEGALLRCRAPSQLVNVCLSFFLGEPSQLGTTPVSPCPAHL
jgi:hypothetical protein